MAAYAALVSLKTTLRQTILMYFADRYPILGCDRDQVDSFLENLDFLQHQFLESAAYTKANTLVVPLQTRIRDAVYEAQDILDIHLISGDYATEPIEEGENNGEYVMKLKNADLRTVIREIDAIKQEIHLLNKDQSLTVTLPDDAQPRPWNSLRAKFGSDSKNVMVGFDDLSLQIKDQLTGESSSSLQVISVVGMGGIGKTTLAISTYNDPYILDHFDIRGWVTVSQSYCKRSMLLDLLDSMKQLTPEMRRESDDELECHLHKRLKEKRYFIVIDDIWDTDAWDCVRRMFPNDDNGSRIMLTTRITDVAAYATSSSDHIYQMSLLSDDSSWILLRAKVFGSESCSHHDLNEIGKDIARKCRGLPLSITVMAGILSKVDKTYEAWEAIAANLTTSLLSSSDDLITSEILKMSYDYLPQHLKSCFLYVGIFPEDHEIEVTKLVNLWIAEGFLDGVCGESSLEEAGERFLGELIDRSLLSTSKTKINGKIKTCKIHDLLLDFCVKESLSEKILQVTKWDEDTNAFPEISTGIQRLSVHGKGGAFPYINHPALSYSLVRSLICTGIYDFPHSVFARLKLLRVLDLIQASFDEFPEQVTELVQLRYLAFLYRGGVIPSSLSRLRYLQTLMINSPFSEFLELFDDVSLPYEIWKMKHLRHIQLQEGNSIFLNYHDSDDEMDSVLHELHTIKGIWDLRFTKKLIRRIPNIRRLGVTYTEFTPLCRFENVADHLLQLVELKMEILFGGRIDKHYCNFGFPKSLETLSLRGTEIPWEDLSSLVGSLPHLKVLELKQEACVGEEWEPKEGDFCELKVLKLDMMELERWNSEPCHFPSLEHLIVRACANLKEIPIEWGESCMLSKIELRHPLGDGVTRSAEKIKVVQYDLGNEDFQVVYN